MAAPFAVGLVGPGLPVRPVGGRVVVPCSSARLNSLLSPLPSTSGQRGIITQCWPTVGPVTMGLILKVSVLLGPPVPALSTKLPRLGFLEGRLAGERGLLGFHLYCEV